MRGLRGAGLSRPAAPHMLESQQCLYKYTAYEAGKQAAAAHTHTHTVHSWYTHIKPYKASDPSYVSD